MTARRKAGRRVKAKTSRRKPEPVRKFTATRVSKTTVRVTKDGVIEIEDPVLCEIVKRLEAEKRKVRYKVVCPPDGDGGRTSSGGGRASGGEGPPDDVEPPETNC